MEPDPGEDIKLEEIVQYGDMPLDTISSNFWSSGYGSTSDCDTYAYRLQDEEQGSYKTRGETK